MTEARLLSVVGARPQFVKASAIHDALQRCRERLNLSIAHNLVHTGQHYDESLSDVFFDELSLPEPDHNLGVGSGSHATQTGRMLTALDPLLDEFDPDVVLVHGDTNSTLAGALAARQSGVPVAHIEAGLRSHKESMPEETNRRLTDHVSRWLFCPSDHAAKQLQNEGISDGIHVVGDVMHGVLERRLDRAQERTAPLHRFDLEPGAYALATVHREGNTESPARLGEIVDALDTIAAEEQPVLVPLHPRTEQALNRHGLAFDHATVADPVPYDDMLTLLSHASIVLTDSGGVQKEAAWVTTPCITLRDVTEWQETVETGWNQLVGADDAAAIVQAVQRADPDPTAVPPYAGADAADAVVDQLIADITCSKEAHS